MLYVKLISDCCVIYSNKNSYMKMSNRTILLKLMINSANFAAEINREPFYLIKYLLF